MNIHISNTDLTAQTEKTTQVQRKGSHLQRSNRRGRTSSKSPAGYSAEMQAAIQVGLAAAKQSPEIRADRVAELQAQIQAGTYQIDSMAIARKMLNEEPKSS